VSPYAFRMIVGAVILVAISVSGGTMGRAIGRFRGSKLAGATQ
jgi:simple sugar transport system permease protein